MFNKKRFINLKSVFMSLFAMMFIFGGLFISTSNVYAAGSVRTVYVSYTLSDVVSTPNTDGGVTTKVLIGCAPGSGDVYDINTGKPCVNFPKKVLIGCAVGSGDLYDINTGKACLNVKPVVMTGCKIGSGDIYDITTGKLCTNNTKVASTTSIQKTPVAITNKVNVKVTPITYNPKETTESIVAQVMKNDTAINNKDDGISGREKVKSSMMATAGKVGTILTGPMSIWIFLLIIVIILGGGYGIYNILKKDDKIEEIEATAKETVVATPIINSSHTAAPFVAKEEVKTDTINPAPQVVNTTGGIASSSIAK